MHAILSASKHHWTNYDLDKMEAVFIQSEAARRGSELHQLAYDLIRLKVRLPKTEKTLNRYVNDAIGLRMTPECILMYSENAFGTADTLGFGNNKLRIHDLKTGVTPTGPRQLEVYAAFFCLEYDVNPFDIDMEFRIYQNDDVAIYDGDGDVIMHIMEKIKLFDRRINELKMEVAL